MIIHNLKTNHITNPLGFTLGTPRLSWVTEKNGSQAKKQSAARVEVAGDKRFDKIVFDSGMKSDIDSLAFPLPIDLQPYTRYFWRVSVWADNGEEAHSEAAWFETAKLDHDGCQGDYFEIDQDQMMMYDDTLKTHLYIFLNFQYSWSNPSNETVFTLMFGESKQLYIYFHGSFKFYVDTLLNIKTTSQYYKDSIIAFHPVWESGSNVFNNVYELYCHQPDHRYTPWISTAYYSIKEGLLGFKTTSGITWNLKK